MSFTVLIPARLASTRLPRKPLADIAGLPMVVRVARQAQASDAQQVVVAADSQEIVQACQDHGVQALLTRVDHASGSDRLAQACQMLGLTGDAVVVNVQGDEPLIEPELIAHCAHALTAQRDCVMSTVAHRIERMEDYLSAHVVKVVLNAQGHAMYFSRSPLPCWRDAPPGQLPQDPPALRHVGLYAYRADFLRQFPELSPAPLERTEALEQLRVLWHGHRIAVHVTGLTPAAGVDTPEDLERVRRLLG